MSNDSAHERNGDADEHDSSAASAGGERKSMSKKDRRADYVWDTPDLGAKKAACFPIFLNHVSYHHSLHP
jgi:hypothetical protein